VELLHVFLVLARKEKKIKRRAIVVLCRKRRGEHFASVDAGKAPSVSAGGEGVERGVTVSTRGRENACSLPKIFLFTRD